jgi:hypothetical protein
MSDKVVAPVLSGDSFNCPNCGAFAHQTWYLAMSDRYEEGKKPWTPVHAARVAEKITKPEDKEMKEFFKKVATGLVIAEREEKGSYLHTRLYNLNVSCCFSCDKYAVWIGDKLIFPARKYPIKPHDDMPEDVSTDFAEAAAIVEDSPRGAGALLRLAIQKLMPHLKEKGKNLNDDIGNLVKKGLDQKIQKALDLVRVIGNNAVHPGQIDLRDDKETVLKLFKLVNLIVESQITTPKHVEEMYKSVLPEESREAIAKRDGTT